MGHIISAAINNYRMVLLTIVVIFFAGSQALVNIPKESEPDITIPVYYVNIHHDGISPEDAERLLVKPMEKNLRTLEGLKEMKSFAYEGGASIVVEFDFGVDPDKTLLEVREEVDNSKKDLPEDTDEPSVEEINVSLFPVLDVVLYGEMPQREMLKAARDLQDDLESLSGVLEVNLKGDREELLEIIIDPLRLESYDISYEELIATVVRNNKLVAAGALDPDEGRFSIKVPGLFETAQDVYNLPIKIDGDSIVTLADITEIRRTYKDAETISRYNGQPSLTLMVTKKIGENVIETVDSVKERVAERTRYWPESLQIAYTRDKSVYTKDDLSTLQNSVISAVLLVMIVVIVALGTRSAMLVAITIPGSFLLSILLLNTLGMSFNVTIMFGLILSVGLLVDGAIVVTEFADRKMHEGIDRKTAYREAATRMSWPILASTATTLAAFLPLLFWPGIVGEFLFYLPIAVITTLLSSFLMAMIFMPTLGALFGKADTSISSAVNMLGGDHEIDPQKLPGLTGRYARFIHYVATHPFRSVVLIFALLISILFTYLSNNNGVVFFPDTFAQTALLQVHARGNMSIKERDQIIIEVENAIADIDGIKGYLGLTDNSPKFGQDMAEDVIGLIAVEFEDWHTRPPTENITAEIRAKTSKIPGIYVEPTLARDGPVQGKDIQIEIQSNFPELLAPVTRKVRHFMETELTGLEDIEDSLPLPGIQWELIVDRAMAGRFNTDILSVGNVVQLVTNGIKIGEYRPDDTDDEVDIRVRFPEEYRNLTQLDELRVQTPHGQVPVGNFVKRIASPKVSTVERVDTIRTMRVKSNVIDGENVNERVQKLREWLEVQEIDERVSVNIVGQDEDQKESEEFLKSAFLMALFLMMLILVTQFNNYYRAFLILLAVVLSTFGVLFGLLITGRSFIVVMTGIGIISLAGIVVNNNIVLIDTYAVLRRRGESALDAIVHTATQRLRPVILTTITTVAGLLPMAFQINIDFIHREVTFKNPASYFWVDLAISVCMGLTFATILTLVLTPAMLAAQVKVMDSLHRFKGARRKTV
ncbi:MAG: MFS transporter [Kordiimonas sp.]|nr:MFS transporter [Kordiimonas sp.]